MKKKLITYVIILFLIFILGYFYEKKIDFFNTKENTKIKTLIKNISSESKISTNTNYKKGDILEFGIIIKPGKNKEITIKLNKFNEIIDISQIKIDGEIINENEINNIKFGDDKVITIKGKAKNDIDKVNQDDEIVIIDKEIEKINKEIVENENIEEELIYKNIENINIDKLNYSSNIDNLIKISGENLEQIEFVNIGEFSYKPQYIKPFLYILVEENNLLKGEQFIFFQKINGEIEIYEKKINFSYDESSLVVVDITPKVLKNDINRNIILQGKGFSKVISIGLSNNIILKNTSFNIINDRVMSVLIPENLNKGNYTLNIMDINGIYKSNINITIN